MVWRRHIDPFPGTREAILIDAATPVVVIYRGGYGAVGIARSLGRLGVPLYLVAQVGMSTPVSSSRYWVKKVRWDFSGPEELSVSFLLDFGAWVESSHGTRPILLTLADWVAIFIERNGGRLRERFLFPEAVQPVVHKLLNKWDMHQLATEHGIPTATTACPVSVAGVKEFAEGTAFPIVLKGADPYAEHLPTKNILHSRQELLDEVDRQAVRGPLNFILQEYIPGGADSVWMCNGYFGLQPEHTVIFTGKKLRQVSDTGIASLAICLPNETVAEQTRRFMEEVGYRGCVGIGYRYDSRDGRYKILDINARVSGVFRLFAGTNEMDVVRVCYLDLTGQDVPATALQPERKWMLESDIVAAFQAMRAGRLTLSEWAASVRGVRELHWLAADDPAPFFSWVAGGIHRGALVALQRASKRSGGSSSEAP